MSDSLRAEPVELAGSRAFVTGGAVRLGRHAALALAERGVDVTIQYRSSADEAAETVEAMRALGVEARAIEADLERPEEARERFEQVRREVGGFDILVNNAAVFPEGDLRSFDSDDLMHCLRINALAPLELIRAFADQGRPGCVVNYLDTRVLDYDHRHVPYHISKRVLFDLTRMGAVEYAPLVRVNAVAPGLILPPPGKNESFLAEMAHTTPLGKYGGPEDVTRALLFLVASPFVTGQTIYLDGGRHMKGRMYE